MHVDQANFVFEVEGINDEKYDFIKGDLFRLDFRDLGRFDIVLCLDVYCEVAIR